MIILNRPAFTRQIQASRNCVSRTLSETASELMSDPFTQKFGHPPYQNGKPHLLARPTVRSSLNFYTDQGCQFTSHEWQRFLASRNLEPSTSRRGNCHDNAVAESFFQLLKRERIRRKTYSTRQEARSDVFSYIEMFYNPIRRHGSAGGLSPVEFERRYAQSGD